MLTLRIFLPPRFEACKALGLMPTAEAPSPRPAPAATAKAHERTRHGRRPIAGTTCRATASVQPPEGSGQRSAGNRNRLKTSIVQKTSRGGTPWRRGSRRRPAWKVRSRTCGAVPRPKAPSPWRSSATRHCLKTGPRPCVPCKPRWSRPPWSGSWRRTRCCPAWGSSLGLAAAHAVHNGLTAAPGTHDYFHGEKVAYGLLVQLVLEGQSRTVLQQRAATSPPK